MADKMEEQEQEEPLETEDQVAEAPQKSSSWMKLVRALAFVSVIVVVEVVVASMVIPSAQETERLGRQFVAATVGQSAQDDSIEGTEYDATEAKRDVREVELGIYNITRYNPTTGTTLAIDFELFGTVLAADEAEFNRLFEGSRVRIREQVIMTLYTAETTDLTDTGLGLIKRQILEKTNRTLGQPLVREVLFSKFNFVER